MLDIKVLFLLVYLNSFNRAFRLGDPIPKPLTEDEKLKETMWKVFEIQTKKKVNLEKDQMKTIKDNFMENLDISQAELDLLKNLRKEQPHFFLNRMKEYFQLTDNDVVQIEKSNVAKAKTTVTHQHGNTTTLTTENTTAKINIKLINPDKFEEPLDSVTIKIHEKFIFNKPNLTENFNNTNQADENIIIARKFRQNTFNDCTKTFGKLLQYFDKLGLTLKDVIESQKFSKSKDEGYNETNKDKAYVNNGNEVSDDSNQVGNRRVYNGLKTHIDHFPFMASISKDGIFRCGGSIVSGHIIITAASCLNLKHEESPNALTVRVGSDYHVNGGKEMTVEHVFIHPRYDEKTKQNNLALLKFTSNTPHKNNIAIITINRRLQPDLNSITILGWGPRHNIVKEKIEPMRSQLSKGKLQIMDLEKCRTAFYSSRSKIKDEHFCATSELHGSGACKYDVGGPGVSGAELVGVVNLIYPNCNRPDAPTVFTRVGPYIDWIDSIIFKFNLTQGNKFLNKRNKKIYFLEPKPNQKSGFDSRLPDSKGKHDRTFPGSKGKHDRTFVGPHSKVINHNSNNHRYEKIPYKTTKNSLDKNELLFKKRGFIVYNNAHHNRDRFQNEAEGNHFQTTIQDYMVTARRLKSLLKNKDIRRENDKIDDRFDMKIDKKILAPSLKTTCNVIHELEKFDDENDEYTQIRYNKHRYTTASLKKHKNTKSWREENYPDQENWNTQFKDAKPLFDLQIPKSEWQKTFDYAAEIEPTMKRPDFESAMVVQEPCYDFKDT